MPPTKQPAQRMHQPPAAMRLAVQMGVGRTMVQAPAPAQPGHRLHLGRTGTMAGFLEGHAQAGTIVGGRSCAKRQWVHRQPRRPQRQCALHAPASGWLKMQKGRLTICLRNDVKLPGWIPFLTRAPPVPQTHHKQRNPASHCTLQAASPAGSMIAVWGAAQEAMLSLPQQPHGAALDHPSLLPSPAHDPWALTLCPPHFLHFLLQAASPASSKGAAGGAAED